VHAGSVCGEALLSLAGVNGAADQPNAQGPHGGTNGSNDSRRPKAGWASGCVAPNSGTRDAHAFHQHLCLAPSFRLKQRAQPLHCVRRVAERRYLEHEADGDLPSQPNGLHSLPCTTRRKSGAEPL
jgi:hypothetical protein